jgi:hypothetical protein
MLVVWGHGYGIDDYLPRGARPYFQRKPRVPASTNALAEISSVLDEQIKKEADWSLLTERIPDSRYIDMVLMSGVFDECALEVLPNAQLGAACKTALPAGKKLSILGFDACTMAMAEVWWEMQGCAHIGVASEAQEPDASFPYDRFLARLILEPWATPEQVAKMIVDAYVESYAYQNNTFVTLSACNLILTKGLQDAVLLLTIALIKAVAANHDLREVIFAARNACPIFDPDGFIDLGRFCQILEVTIPDQDVCTACCKVQTALGSFIEYARYSPLDPALRISQTTGLSLWFPPWLEDPFVEIPEKEASIAYLINGYDCTEFGRNTYWGRFLRFMWRKRPHCPDSLLGTLVGLPLGGSGEAEGQTKTTETQTAGEGQ